MHFFGLDDFENLRRGRMKENFKDMVLTRKTKTFDINLRNRLKLIHELMIVEKVTAKNDKNRSPLLVHSKKIENIGKNSIFLLSLAIVDVVNVKYTNAFRCAQCTLFLKSLFT